MLLFYIRHGDPIYNPDQLTPLGERQAESVAKRLALFGIDKIYSSPSPRAMQTARPTSELVQKEIVPLDWANESHAYGDMGLKTFPKSTWPYQNDETRRRFNLPEVRALGNLWYTHPLFEGETFENGVTRMKREADAFLASLGYEYDAGANGYRAVAPTDERVALFAHEGAGMLFMSTILGIPYNHYCTHFAMCHSSMTVIEFRGKEGDPVFPTVLELSNDGHLYRDGLPLAYNKAIRF